MKVVFPSMFWQEERKQFEHWYCLHQSDLVANPIGSRECSLQWKAWEERTRRPLSNSNYIQTDFSLAEPEAKSTDVASTEPAMATPHNQSEMTKRELIAAMALQGFVTSWGQDMVLGRTDATFVLKSVQLADALIVELNKESY